MNLLKTELISMIIDERMQGCTLSLALKTFQSRQADMLKANPILQRLVTFYSRFASEVSLGIANDNVRARRAQIDRIWSAVSEAVILVCILTAIAFVIYDRCTVVQFLNCVTMNTAECSQWFLRDPWSGHG